MIASLSAATTLPSNLRAATHLLAEGGVHIAFYFDSSTGPEDFGYHWHLALRCGELNSLFRSEAVMDRINWNPTPFGFGLLADFITDHLDRLASVATVYPETDPVPVIALWRDWCRQQFLKAHNPEVSA